MTTSITSSLPGLGKLGIATILAIMALVCTPNRSLASESWDYDDLVSFIDGAAIMAAGGGGSPAIAKQLLTKYFPSSGSIVLDEISDIPSGGGDFAASFGAIGSPANLFNLPDPLGLPYNSYVAMDLTFLGDDGVIRYLMPIEVGPINGLYAFLLAEKLNALSADFQIAVLDVDGGGRSVPTLPLLIYSYFPEVYNQQAVVSSQYSVVPRIPPRPTEWALLTADGESQDRIENTILAMLTGKNSPYAGAAGYGSFFAKADDISVAPPVTGQIGIAQKVGKAYEGASQGRGLEVAYILRKAGRNAKSVFSGKVIDITLDTSGLDYGVVTISGTGFYEGHTFKIQYENENICAYSDQYSTTKPFVLGPDSVAYAPTNGTVFDNSDLYDLVHNKKQQPRVDIVAIKTDQRILDLPEIMKSWGNVRAAIPEGACDFPYSSPWENS